MDFTVPEEIEMLRRTLRRFVTEEVIPLERDNDLTWDVAPPKELRKQVRLRSKEIGLYGVDMPKDVGGGGFSLSDACLLEMEAHFHDTVFFLDLLGGGIGPSSPFLTCTERQKERYLSPLISGEVTTCLALSEPDAGSDPTAIRTRAEKRADGFLLNGTKNIISNAVQADFAMVFAVTDEKLGAMATELFAAENMVLRTAWMKDQGMDIRKEAAMTKLFCSEMVNRAAYEAIQIHGGVGCLRETNVERVYRMVRIFTIIEGTSEMQRLAVASRLLEEERW